MSERHYLYRRNVSALGESLFESAHWEPRTAHRICFTASEFAALDDIASTHGWTVDGLIRRLLKEAVAEHLVSQAEEVPR